MKPHEIDRIAAAFNALRPDWPIKQLRTLLSDPRLANRPRRDVAVALAWVASESVTTTPYRVIETGPWWRAAAVDADPVAHPPKKPDECRQHPGEYAHACRACAAERKGGPGYGHDDDPPPDQAWTPQTVKEAIRRQG